MLRDQFDAIDEDGNHELDISELEEALRFFSEVEKYQIDNLPRE